MNHSDLHASNGRVKKPGKVKYRSYFFQYNGYIPVDDCPVRRAFELLALFQIALMVGLKKP